MRCAEGSPAVRAAAVAAALLLAAGVGPVGAAGLREVGDGFLLDAADVATLLAPARQQDGGLWVAAGQARLWSMPELPLLELAAGGAWRRGGGAVVAGALWHRTGGGLVGEDSRRAWLGWRGGWDLRLELEDRRLAVAGETVAGETTVRAAAGPVLALGDAANLRLRLIAALGREPAPSRRLEPAGRATLLLGGGAVALAWDRWTDGTPALGAEFCAALGGAAAVSVRWDGASGSLGPGLAVRLGPALLRTSHAVHPVLGVTHRFALWTGALHAARR